MEDEIEVHVPGEWEWGILNNRRRGNLVPGGEGVEREEPEYQGRGLVPPFT